MAVLETIKTIGDLVPEIQNLRARCRQTCSDLEVVLVNLRQKLNDDLRKQEIEGKAEQGVIYLKKNKFNDTNPIVKAIDVNKEIFIKDGKGSGHHGGDYEIMNSIVSYLNGNHNIVTITKLEDSINGHLVVYAADKSRLEGKTEKIR